jgi:hypothetical protein
MNTDDTTPKTDTDTTRRTPVSPANVAPRRPTASAYPVAGASADTTRRPTVPPALLAAAAALLVAVPERERVAFWRLVRVSLARVHWYARLAAKMFRLAAPVDLDRALVPAREGVDLALVAVREECDARGLASVLDALFAALLGHTPDAVPEHIGVAGLVARADDALAVWAHVGHAHGVEVEPAAPVAQPDTAPLPHDPRFNLVFALVGALQPADRDAFLEAFAVYLEALAAAVRLGERATDAAQMTGWQVAEAAADVLLGTGERRDHVTLPNADGTWETADALAAALLHDTVKGVALSEVLFTKRVEVHEARVMLERVRAALDLPTEGERAVETTTGAASSGPTVDDLRAAVDEARALAPEFPGDLLQRAAVYAVQMNARLSGVAVAHLAAVQIRHAVAGRYSADAVDRAEVFLTSLPVEQGVNG